MTSKELTAQGIDALKKGKKDEAHDLLEQAVELDPNNAKAWYFLSRVQTSVADKRTSLNTVLAINPDNQLAKDALEKLDDEDYVIEAEYSDPEPDIQEESKPKEHPSWTPYQQEQSAIPPFIESLPRMGLGSGHKTRVGNLQVPLAIEDAPPTSDGQTIWNEFVQTIRNGFEILRRTPDVYFSEVQRASWWRFWQIVIIALVISAVLSSSAGYLLESQQVTAYNNSPFTTEPDAPPSVFALILSLIFYVPVNILMLYIGIYASHWFIVTRRNGQASLMRHAYTILLPIITARLIISVASMVLALVPILILLALISLLVLWIYSMYIAAQGLTMVHEVDDNTGYWTMGVYVAATFVVNPILSPLLLTVGLI